MSEPAIQEEHGEHGVLTVSELTAQVKGLIDAAFATVWVTGEVSNFRRQTSGHCYFTLKDASCQLKCVMWRTSAARLPVSPTDGMQVLVRGTMTVYEAYGQYQLIANYLQPAGIGALQQAFEALKARLSEEGLFDPDRKRPLPELPRVVGVVTSGTGAAVRDIITVISRRMPTTRIIVRPTQVQGAGAAEDISRAIAELNAQGESDVLIVGRGGGSVEDLWCFNEESVVRAVAGSKIPIVSAVGHEIDYSLSDYAADMRAPTPSAAAELIVPDSRERMQYVAGLYRELIAGMNDRLEDTRERITDAWNERVPARLLDRIDRSTQDVDRLMESIERRMERIVSAKRSHLGELGARLDALSPLRVLARGYAVCERDKDGKVITAASDVDPKERFRVRLQRGIILGIVESRMG